MSLDFLCIIPDLPGVQSRRMEVRSKHLEAATARNAEDVVPLAGAMLARHPTEAGAVPEFKGSVLVVRAASAEAARDILRADVYVAHGVWDLDAAQVIPFKIALTPKAAI